MRTRTHISLGVSNLNEAVSFYQTMFGTIPTKHLEDFASFRLDTPALHLSLVPSERVSDGVGREASHFGVELFDHDALGAWRGRVEAAGLKTFIEEDVTCCYAKADKFWLTDPDGRPWEFWVRKAEADSLQRSMPTQTPEGLAACCAPEPQESAGAGGCCD